MATRFKLHNATPDFDPSTQQNWTTTASASNAQALTSGASINVQNNASGPGGSGDTRLTKRSLTGPLAAADLSGTLKGQMRALETNATDNYTLALAVSVFSYGGTYLGSALAVSASDATTTPPEMALTATNRRFQDAAESAALTLSSIGIPAGGRLSIEVGFRAGSTSTALSSLFYRSGAGADLAEDDTTTASNDSWFEFSQTLDGWAGAGTDIIYFGSASTPADGTATTNTTDPTVVTPPTGMLAGDLVWMIGDARIAGLTLAVSETGGQAWTPHAAISATTKSVRVFTCTFNGTWSANPSVSFGSSTCNSGYMHTFRPPTTSYTWSINQAQVASADTTDPFTVTGQTTTGTNPTVSMVGQHSPDDNTWGSITGAGWEVTGGAQYRNTSGSDQSASFAHKIQTSAGATGDVGKSQLSLGADTAQQWIITMEAVPPVVADTVLIDLPHTRQHQPIMAM